MKRPERTAWPALLVLALALGLATAAQAEPETQAFQAHLEATRAKDNIAGMTAGVARNGKIIWLGASGLMDVEQNVPANPGMIHRIASIAKPMTAVAVMQLQQYRRLNVQDPLRNHLPYWPELDEGEIRIQHLLNHTSGIKHYTGADNRPFENYPTLRDAVEFIMMRRHGPAPGDRYAYSTYGYTVLGAVIEAASGLAYGDYMRDYVWVPAAMRHTSLEVQGAPVENKSKLYRHDRDGNIVDDDYTNLSVKYPGGGIQSTAGDLLRFAIAFENETLLQRASRDEMLTITELRNPRTDDRPQYGYGWNLHEHERLGRTLFHSGGQAGTVSFLLIARDRNVAVSVLSNTSRVGDISALAWNLAERAAGTHTPAHAPSPESAAATKPD